MDSTKKYNNPSPEVRSNLISKLFFCWILPLFNYGYKNDIEAKDLYNVAKPDLSEPLGNILEKHWNKELVESKAHETEPSLTKAIWKTFFKQTMVLGSVLFVQCIVLRMIHPLILAEMINYFNPTSQYSLLDGWLLAIGVVFIAFANCLIMHHVLLQSQRIGMRCRVACCSLMYRKLLRLSKASLGKTAAGHIINLMTNDVQRFDVLFGFIHYIWIMPIQACVAAVIMYKSVGMAAIAGLLAMAVQAILLQGYLSKLQGTFRFKIAQRTDSRVKFMSEITSSIQVIKMYAWEKPFEKVVRLARKLEIDVLTKTSYIRGFMTALMVFTERFTLYLTVITYVLLGHPLTSDKVFSLAQFFNTIQLYMAIFFPMAIVSLAEAKVSVKRIRDFLLLEENVTPAVANVTVNETCGSIRIENGRASWIPNPIIETLTDLNLNINPGSLCAIVGPVGAGKSSLLQLLLKELPLRTGKMEINGDVSFASQEPWLFVSTVRNNVLFGQQYVKNRYKDVVDVCALQRDFEQFPQGDKTLVGERGVSLSGGQRARINLARAVYREADIYLFDDPLSAVDAHVGNHLFEKCILNFLKDKTRILVTHQQQFLKRVDQIIIVNNGQIVKIGTFEELSNNELSHLKESLSTEDVHESPEREISTHKRLVAVNSINSTKTDEEELEETTETQELVEKGSLSISIYMQFFKAGAGMFVLLFLGFLLIIAQACSNAGDMWVTHWTNKEMLRERRELEINAQTLYTNASYKDELNSIHGLKDESQNVTYPNVTELSENSLNMDEIVYSTNVYIYIYTLFIVCSIILTTMRSLLFYKICMNAAKNLHNNMFNNVLQATMRFFDTNPSGRILNRFSKDIGTIDEILPRFMLEGVQVFMVMTGILIMVFIYTPWMIIPAVILGLVFNLCRIIYLASAQDIKRLEGTTRAPAFSHVSASLSGLTTIRSCKAQYMVSKEFDVLQDQHTSSWYLTLVSMETFGVYLDIICVVFLMLVTFQFLVFDDGTTMSGNVGLVISQSLILTGMLQHGMRQAAEVASNMTSVERVLQYSKIDKEGPFESTPTKKPHRDWPQNGFIEFQNMQLRYVPTDPPVLKNLNIIIKAGEKVGVVGRTGAGKSSLISALFRLAPIEGTINIDEVDINDIGLHDLRSKISIIPQEPILFSASIRNNLDPFDKCDDKTLWKALEDVELKDAIESLEQEVQEGGTNFSAGQRQLICLARAIVRNNKVLILDEATANVDPQTDALIQTTIRKNFADCTVLTIAHRLNTIMDSDKVLVMDAGEAVEFGVPHELLQDPNGYLSKMVHETGNNMETKLRKVAEETYNPKQIEK